MSTRVIRIGDEIDQRLNQTDHNSTEHCTIEIANAPKYGCSKSDKAKPKANRKGCGRKFQKINETGCTSQASANKECERNNEIDINTHECGSLAILGNCTHSMTKAGTTHHPLQADHQQ